MLERLPQAENTDAATPSCEGASRVSGRGQRVSTTSYSPDYGLSECHLEAQHILLHSRNEWPKGANMRSPKLWT